MSRTKRDEADGRWYLTFVASRARWSYARNRIAVDQSNRRSQANLAFWNIETSRPHTICLPVLLSKNKHSIASSYPSLKPIGQVLVWNNSFDSFYREGDIIFLALQRIALVRKSILPRNQGRLGPALRIELWLFHHPSASNGDVNYLHGQPLPTATFSADDIDDTDYMRPHRRASVIANCGCLAILR